MPTHNFHSLASLLPLLELGCPWGMVMLSQWYIMIKDILKRREESDTYLTHVCRHRWSRKISMKVDGVEAFSLKLKSGRCRSLLIILKYFLSFHLSRFSQWYIYIKCVCLCVRGQNLNSTKLSRPWLPWEFFIIRKVCVVRLGTEPVTSWIGL